MNESESIKFEAGKMILQRSGSELILRDEGLKRGFRVSIEPCSRRVGDLNEVSGAVARARTGPSGCVDFYELYEVDVFAEKGSGLMIRSMIGVHTIGEPVRSDGGWKVRKVGIKQAVRAALNFPIRKRWMLGIDGEVEY